MRFTTFHGRFMIHGFGPDILYRWNRLVSRSGNVVRLSMLTFTFHHALVVSVASCGCGGSCLRGSLDFLGAGTGLSTTDTWMKDEGWRKEERLRRSSKSRCAKRNRVHVWVESTTALNPPNPPNTYTTTQETEKRNQLLGGRSLHSNLASTYTYFHGSGELRRIEES